MPCLYRPLRDRHGDGTLIAKLGCSMLRHCSRAYIATRFLRFEPARVGSQVGMTTWAYGGRERARRCRALQEKTSGTERCHGVLAAWVSALGRVRTPTSGRLR